MAQYVKAQCVAALVDHFRDDYRRIDHALRVTAWAEQIWEVEGGDYEVVLAVGLLHDVGIKKAEAIHGKSDGKLQEKYGPDIVRKILKNIGFSEDKIEECCAIVGKHHTPEGVPGPNFPILWDADLLVNLKEDLDQSEVGVEQMQSIIEKSFRTQTGKKLARLTLLA